MTTDWTDEEYTGSDATGSSGGSSRVLTLANTKITKANGILIKVSGLALKLTTEYTISHKDGLSEITFVNPLWDDQEIEVSYYIRTSGNSLIDWRIEDLSGSDATGSDGGSSRVLTMANIGTINKDEFFVYASGLLLTITTDYTVSHNEVGSEITFVNPLWDSMTIVLRYWVSSDFNSGPLSDFGVLAIRTPVTVATNYSGNKTYTDGSQEGIDVTLAPYKTKYDLDKSGLNKSYDAVAYFRADDTINKYDKITHDSRVYRVDNVSVRDFAATGSFQLAMLYFSDDE